jgi:hypothetical protein
VSENGHGIIDWITECGRNHCETHRESDGENDGQAAGKKSP